MFEKYLICSTKLLFFKVFKQICKKCLVVDHIISRHGSAKVALFFQVLVFFALKINCLSFALKSLKLNDLFSKFLAFSLSLIHIVKIYFTCVR